MNARDIVDQLLESGPEFKTLKVNQKKLSDEERDEAGDAPIKKSVINGTVWYWSNTHRCYQARRTLKAAVAAYWKIVEPSG